MPFELSKPIKKENFVLNLKESVELCQIALSPFGPSGDAETLSDLIEQSFEDNQAYYQQWEEIFSRQIYRDQNISDDSIAASVHKYLRDIRSGDEIEELMQKTVTYGATMYSIPEVVDMSVDSLVSGVDVLCTDSIPSGDLRQLLEVKLGEFVCSANICALLLDRVLTALMLIVTGCDQQLTVHGQKAGCRSTGGSLSLAISSPFEVDQGAFDAFGLRIPVRPFPVLEVLSNISNFQMLKSTDENTPLPVATIDTGLAALRRAFRFSTQDADVVPLLDESFVSLLSEGEVNRKCSWSIGTAQYHALLDLFGGSTEVSKVLTRHRLTSVHSDGVNSGNNPIKSFQIGQYSISDSNTAQRKLSLADLCSALSANPSVSYVLQLQSILQKIKEEGNEQDTELLTKVKLAEMALEKVRYAIAMKIKAKRLAEEMGEVEQAMEALSKALSPTHSKLKVKSKKADEEEDDEDENENEDEDEDEEESDEEEDDELEGDDGNSKGTFDKSTLLPAHLKVDLLLLRVEYAIAVMDEENDESVSSTVKAALARQTWSDCQLAMELDGRHVEAFRMRAKLLQFMAQNGALFPSLCAEVLSLARVESEDVPNSLRNLSMEDSLSAFLLSGCTDFVSASGAEEVAREKCRPQAKEAFQQKVASGSSQFSLPRQWTVRAFFMGHPLLSTALSLDLQSCLFPIPVSQSMTKGSNQIMDGIDDDTTQQPILERPPLHMIDTLLLASANDSSSDEKTDDQVFKVLRPDDCRAFQLLKELVALFDGMWLHGPDNKPADESDGADDNDDNEDDESTGNDESDDAATSCFTKSEHMATEDELLSLCGKVLGTNDAGEYDSSSESYLVGCGTANSIDSGRFKSDDTEMDKLADTLVSKTNKLIRASLRTNNRPKSLLPESAPSISTFLDLQMNSAASSGISSKSCDVFVKALTLLSSESTTTLSGVDFRFNTTADYATPVMVGPITPVATLIKGDDKNVVESTDDSDSVWEDVASEDEDDEASEETGDDSASTNEVDKVLTAEQMTTLESRTVSYQLQARLLNVCSSICYLIGDATKAVQCLRLSSQCFRNSIRLSTDCRIPSSHFYIDESGVVSSPLGELIPFDRIATDSASSSLYNAPERNLLLDTYIRLGSLLSDMDEVEEAQDLFKLALKIDPRSASALTHSAENEIQKSNFEGALELLKKAKQVSQSNQITTRLHKLKLATSQLFGDNGQLSSNMPTAQQALVVENIGQQAQQNSLSTIISLLALAQFRESPNSPELAMREVHSGLALYPRSEYLLLCQGEIFCQVGEAIGALKLFKKVSEMDPDHPLPYLNAARVYQQLGQQVQSLRHMRFALEADPTFSVARVDLAQHLLHLGHTEAAKQTLDSALSLARHVSEIKEVLTARAIATTQLELESRGLLFHSR